MRDYGSRYAAPAKRRRARTDAAMSLPGLPPTGVKGRLRKFAGVSTEASCWRSCGRDRNLRPVRLPPAVRKKPKCNSYVLLCQRRWDGGMRWLLAAIGGLLLSCPGAFANCESDAKAAFADTCSGAYHFEKDDWSYGKPVRVIGEVIPGVRTRYRYEGQERKEYSERIPGTDWSRDLSVDAFGWKSHGNGRSIWRDEPGYRPWDRNPKEYKCYEEKKENNKRVLVFSVATRDAFGKQEEDRLFVTPWFMLPYHRR